MTLKCICQICNCGKHKCPIHYRCAEVEPWNDTEYRNNYPAKPLIKTKSCKPDDLPYQSCAPIQCETTARADFRKQPLPEVQKRCPDPYQPPEGCMDNLTCYRKEYTQKPFDLHKPTKCVPPKVILKFSDETCNRTDYRRWPLGPQFQYKPPGYQPLCDPFDGISNYTTAYRRHDQPVRPSMKPNADPYQSCDPLEGRTIYRDNYVKHCLPEPFVRKKDAAEVCCVPLDGLTNYRKDYLDKGLVTTKSFKPDTAPMISCDPFEGKTTQRVDYVPKPLGEPFKHSQDPYQPPEGCMVGDTNYRLAYTAKPLNPAKPLKPSAAKVVCGKSEDITSHRADFRRWCQEPVKPCKRDEYQPVCGPFEGEATYRRDYRGWRQPVRPSMKPETEPHVSCDPCETCTEYRCSYTKKDVNPCPAAPLQIGAQDTPCFSFKQEDCSGHKWFEPKCLEVC